MSFFRKLNKMRQDHLRNGGDYENYQGRKDEESVDEIYDANTLEICFSSLPNDDSTSSSQGLNFILYNRRRKPSQHEYYSATFYEQMIMYISDLLFGRHDMNTSRWLMLIACILSLLGYVYYRWLYLKRREERQDFVDLALRQKYRFLK
ncbi:hypothetical protein C9374_014649 [Naegleria lovaniensis]|uniref:Uncharacterized protein n=1 Tax=Naegleria lovaniensis TaxID=51637 RepID=A0AA88H0E6_NAELO|nr:uncharacterized protein C9374_014649 [Naegleria lovaniensis]KAG2389249.1 hypothetical protein C9374_014649 [Naegleria lovaniensis]